MAALSVVLWHWQHFFYGSNGRAPDFDPTGQPLYPVFKVLYLHGWMAVDLFFLLSGFIFFWLYADRISQGLVSARDFFVLRVSRLYPLHLVTLLAVIIGQHVYLSFTDETVAFVYRSNDFYHLSLNLMMLSSIGLEQGPSFNAPFWSVSVEVALYLIFFLLALRLLPFVRSTWQQAVVLGLLVCIGMMLERIYGPLSRGIFSFFLGGLVCIIYSRVRANESVSRWAKPIILVTALCVWILVLVLVTFDLEVGQNLFVELTGAKLAFLGVRMVLFPLTVLALALLDLQMRVYPRGLSILGDISYSSYLWHFPLQLAFVSAAGIMDIDRTAFYAPQALLLFFGLLIPVSYASYHWLEMPLQKVLRSRAL